MFLINKLPTDALSNFDSPYKALHNKQPDYNLLKVFGNSCFPHVSLYNKNKLEFRSLKYTYLGVSPTNKGHKCLSHEGKLYVSNYVVFIETEFVWNTTNSKDDYPQQKHSLHLRLPSTLPTQATNLVSPSTTNEPIGSTYHHVTINFS